MLVPFQQPLIKGCYAHITNPCERSRRVSIDRWKRYHKKYEDHLKTIPDDTYTLMKARLHGYICGDGSISARRERERSNAVHYEIRFYPDDKNMLEKFMTAYETLYLDTPRVVEEKRYAIVRVTSKVASLDILKEGPFGALDWSLPSSLFTNTANKIEWLRAFFDSEAHVGKAIQVQSVNEKGLLGVQRLLAEFGILSRMYTYERRQAAWNTNYLLVLTHKKERTKFLNKIGFYHAKKQEKLRENITPPSHNLVQPLNT